MSRIELAAIRGDNVLGFLAACGVLRLLAEELDAPDSTLAWPNAGAGSAVITTDVVDNVDQLAEVLFGVVDRCRDVEQLVPGRSDIPLRATGGDPMNKLSFADGRGLSESLVDADGQRWLASMVSLASPGDDGTLDRSRWWSVGPGPVTIAGTLEKALEAIRSVDDVSSALTAWRRYDWVAGYLDQAADVGKERIPSARKRDESVKAGVIGAPWLALMATQLFPIRARNERSYETTGWRVVDRLPSFTYPLWQRSLDLAGVVTLLDHPAVHRSACRADELRALGVGELRRAVRLRTGKNNTAVTPAQKIWPVGRLGGK